MNIVLDDENGAFEPGETISGEVVAHGQEALVGPLRIELSWSTEGKGGSDATSVAAAIVGDQGPQRAGRFSLVAPLAPYTFHGKLLSVTWSLQCDRATRVIVIAPGRTPFVAPLSVDREGAGCSRTRTPFVRRGCFGRATASTTPTPAPCSRASTQAPVAGHWSARKAPARPPCSKTWASACARRAAPCSSSAPKRPSRAPRSTATSSCSSTPSSGCRGSPAGASRRALRRACSSPPIARVRCRRCIPTAPTRVCWRRWSTSYSTARRSRSTSRWRRCSRATAATCARPFVSSTTSMHAWAV